MAHPPPWPAGREIAWTLGQALRDCRLRVGVTQAEFASLLGVSERHLRRLERGDCQPPYDVLLVATRRAGLRLRVVLEAS